MKTLLALALLTVASAPAQAACNAAGHMPETLRQYLSTHGADFQPCSTSDDCSFYADCVDGYCINDIGCNNDDECAPGSRCLGGTCI